MEKYIEIYNNIFKNQENLLIADQLLLKEINNNPGFMLKSLELITLPTLDDNLKLYIISFIKNIINSNNQISVQLLNEPV